MKNIIFIIGTIVLSACSARDEQFCECLEIGNQLNEISEGLLTEGTTGQSAQELKELKAKKVSVCQDYLTMDGVELIQKKAACLP
jgi:hypothetical protein